MKISLAAPLRGQNSSARYYGFIALLTCFVLGILFSTAYTLYRLRDDALNSHFSLGAMYARTFEDHLTQSCNFVDRILTSHIEEISGGKSPETLGKSFTISLRNMPFLRSLCLFDRAGIIVASSNPLNIGRNLVKDSLFLVNDTGLLRVGRPWSGRDFADGHELVDSSPVTPDILGFIPLLRPFESDGSVYTLVATLNPDYFINNYRQTLVHTDDQVELLRYDGTPLVFTGDKELFGKHTQNRAFIADLEEIESGNFVGSEPGQPPSLVSYRASRLFPLVVVTRIDRAYALAEWEKEKQRLLLVVIPSLVLVVGAAILLYLRQRRIQEVHAEAERRENEKFTATVFATVAEAMLAIDTDAKIVLTNPALTKVSGYTAEEMIGKTTDIFASGVHDADCYRQMWEELKQFGFWQGEIHNCRKDGSPWIVWTTISPLCDEQGGITHYVVGYSDITERKEMEESLRCAKEEAELSTRAKSQFLALMSHEIRTPMNGVIGMTGLLLDTPLNKEQQQYAEIVRKSGESLLEIINDILDFSKIEAHRLDLEEIPFTLRTTLEDTLEIMATKAHDKGLEIICLVDPAIPRKVVGDPGRLRQVLMNLAGNAIKFTEKGEVSIQAELLAADTEELQIRFQVKDTGIGIPADRVEAIFEPFMQADGTTTRKFGGTGLGLAISRQLCQLMGGELRVESIDGQGSIFWFTTRFKNVAVNSEPTPHFAPLGGLNILVVDDNDTNRQLLATFLTGWGCRYASVAYGNTALCLLREAHAAGDPFQLVLLDHQMPGMDGFTLTNLIREDATYAQTLLVMLTSFGNRGDALAMQRAGLNAYLTKPLRQQQLYDCLSLLMGRQTTSESAVSEQLVTRHTINEARRGAIKILIAEDNPVNQAVAVAMLKKLGYRADVVDNGIEALEALSRIPYNLVLMDCQMLKMDGFETTQAIRNPATNVLDHTVPIIAMTANAMKGDSDRCLAAGMNDYLSKPVNSRDLEQMLAKWLNNGETAVELPLLESSLKPNVVSDAAPEIFNVSCLYEQLDDISFMKEIIDIALNDIPVIITQLAEAYESGDLPMAQHHAHALKGIAGSLCADALHGTTTMMESAMAKGDMEEVGSLMQQTREEGVVLISALTQWKDEN